MAPYPEHPSTEFEKKLRRAAEEIHPRPAFIAGLRASLVSEQVQPSGKFRFPWARPLLVQIAPLMLLVGLVALALVLTPQIVPELRPGQQIEDTSTPLPEMAIGGDPNALPSGALARLGQGQILAMDAAPDGRLAVGSTMGICVYNIGHTPDWCVPFGMAYQINWILFNPSADRLALALGDSMGAGKLLVLDAANGSVLAGHPLPSAWPGQSFYDAAVAWDPSGMPRLAMPGEQGTLLVWDWEYDMVVWGPLDIHDSVSADQSFVIDWALDDQEQTLLAAGGRNGLLLLDGLTGQERLRLAPTWQVAPVGNISALDLSADGRWLAYGYGNGAVALRIEGGQVTQNRLWETFWQPMHIAIGPQSMGYPLAVQVKEGTRVIPIEGQGEPVTFPSGYSPLAWTPQGTLYYARADGMLGIYENGQDNMILTEYSVWPEHIAWSGMTDLLSLHARAITRWDTGSGRLGAVSSVTGGNPVLLAVSLDGARAAYYLEGEAAINVWDTASNQPVARLEKAYRSSLAAFSHDGARLVTIGPNGQLAVWDASSGQVVREQVIEEMNAAPLNAQLDALAVTPDGRAAALAWYRDNALHLDVWDLEAGVKTRELPISTNVTAMAWSPDGRTLAAATSGAVTLWDAASGKRLQVMGPEPDSLATDTVWKESTGTINAIAWAPDGQILATGGGVVTVWDAAQGLPLRAYGGHGGLVSDVAFRPDGRMLASSSVDGTILLWDLGAGGLPPADSATPTPLSAAETPEPALPTPTPLLADPTPEPPPAGSQEYTEESKSIDGRWTASVQHSVKSAGDQPMERVHTLTVAGPDGQQFTYSTSEDLTGPGSSDVSWSVLKWWPPAPNALYWFENVQPGNQCEAPYSTNLRRMDLTTGQVEVLKGGSDWRSILALSIDTSQAAYLEGNQLVIRDLEQGVEQLLDVEPVAADSWAAMMLDIIPGGQGVLLAQRAPAVPECDSREIRQKVTLFQPDRGKMLEQTLPANLQFRGYETAGLIIAADAQGALFRVALESGKVEPRASLPGDEAGNVLWAFLTFLARGADTPNVYQQAADLYGGSWEELMRLNPDVPGNQLPMLLQRACENNGYRCGPIQQFQTDGERNGFLFVVDYTDGSHGAFRVQKNANGEYKVMDLPPRKE